MGEKLIKKSSSWEMRERNGYKERFAQDETQFQNELSSIHFEIGKARTLREAAISNDLVE